MIHVAVLLKPYIDLIRTGEKTVECRLTKQARAPYDRIETGDRIYFKESAGPYHLSAIADHVLFEDRLTPGRIREIRRDYNELIRGDKDFWQWKRDSRYLTLVWLREVEAIDTGPGIRPLQGVAWFILPDGREETPRSEVRPHKRAAQVGPSRSPALSFSVPITEGNLRNNSLYVTRAIDRFPAWSVGGRNRAEAAQPITLLLRDGPTVQTDIVGPRKLFRSRHWGAWFEQVGAQPGDHVVFTPIDESTYHVGLTRRA